MGLIMKNGIQYPGVCSGEGSGLEISQLDDVKITPPLENGDKLVYDKEKGKWTNTTKYHNYSTEEQIIGTWIDGKPIYEAVIDIGDVFIANANTWTLLPIFPQNVKCVIKFVGIQQDGDAYNTWNLNASNSGDVFNYRSNIVQITQYIIQYTKTTD